MELQRQRVLVVRREESVRRGRVILSGGIINADAMIPKLIRAQQGMLHVSTKVQAFVDNKNDGVVIGSRGRCNGDVP